MLALAEAHAYTFQVIQLCHRELYTPKDSRWPGRAAGANQSRRVVLPLAYLLSPDTIDHGRAPSTPWVWNSLQTWPGVTHSVRVPWCHSASGG